jgi:ferrochelatase
MLFENLTSLIDGELLNEPSIASFSKIVFDAKKVKRGDLFFGSFKEIDEALENGAYGIVSTKIKVKDDEIAWIKVKDIQSAKIKLLRYFILKDGLSVVKFSTVEAELAKSISLNKNILYIDSDINSAIKDLDTNHDLNLIAFINDDIYSKIELEEQSIELKYKITVQKATTFLTTFIYGDNLFKEIKISELFVRELERVLNLFDTFDIKYHIQKLNFINHFKPLFLDSSFKILNFGQSRKVFILEFKKELLEREILYVKEKASWAKIALLLPQDIKYTKKIDIDIKYFKNYADIKKQNIFYYNFVIMLDVEQKFEKYLQKNDNDIKNRLF